MKLLRRLRSIVALWFRRERVERELSDELETFVAMSAADKVRDGCSPDEARRLALIELGGIEQARERVRTYRHGGGLDDVGRDVRYACRMFRRTPGFTAVVIVTMALGIGANTAVFSVIEALMLRPLPVPHASELMQLNFGPVGSAAADGESLSYAMVKSLDSQREIFSGVAGFSGFGFDAGRPGAIESVGGALVTGAYYETLGLIPVAGRLLTRADDEPGAPSVAVISHGYWQRQFAGRADVIGESLLINRHPVSIVGISPPGFVGANVGSTADITIPVAAVTALRPSLAPILLAPGTTWLRVLARPKPGVTLAEAAGRLNNAWPGLSENVMHPSWDAERRRTFVESRFSLSPGSTGWTDLRATYRQPLSVLMAVTGLVLLVACANVAGLMVVRSTGRQREMAIRLAIGAARSRIVRQLLLEGVVLSMVGAIAGLGIAAITTRILLDLVLTGSTFDLSLRWPVVGFAASIGVLSGVAASAIPAWYAASGRSTTLALRYDSRTSTARSRWLPVLVTVQVALSLVLLAGAGLLARTLKNLQGVDRGFSTDAVLFAMFDRALVKSDRHLLDAMRSVPAVNTAALITYTPLSGARRTLSVVPLGQPFGAENAHVIAASPGFEGILGIAPITGRTFTDADTMTASRVALVNEAYARAHFPSVNPIGSRLALKNAGGTQELEVVGVLADVRTESLRAAAPQTVYLPYAQTSDDFLTTVLLRVSGPPGDAIAPITQALQRALPTAPVAVRRLSDQVDATINRERMLATLATGFGVLSLVLACVGLYGLLAYGVSQRSKEIGIRMALGAQAPRVVTMVFAMGARPVVAGLIVGLALAGLASRGIASFLYGLAPMDPVAIGGAVVVLFCAALTAAWLPARRASRIDPLNALRHD